MSFYPKLQSSPRRFRLVLSSFLQTDGLPFAEALTEGQIQEAFDREDASFAAEEDRVYTPSVTLWAFLSQVLFKDEHRSCVAAVARVVVLLVALGKEPCSNNTGAYCRARAKLPEKVIRRLTTDVAEGCEQRLPQQWLWHGRHVKLVDGTTVSMPDTPENQAQYPQNPAQKEGLGFPIMRMIVLLSLATAMVAHAAMGPYSGKETGETALLRQLLDELNEGDVLLGDRYYCSYLMLVLLLLHGVDFVVRLHQNRQADFSRGKRLGKEDHLVEWTRPVKPDWMDQETYDRIPESITLRELKVHVDQPGFRTKSLVIVTSLTDANEYSKDDIAELYRQRWQVELDIRTIKVTLGMEVLRCKTPEMVRREVWSSLLAYNLIRKTMLQAARQSGISPRRLSFTAAMQAIGASWIVVLLLDPPKVVRLIEVELSHIGLQTVGDRPDRVEPHAVKHRPKQQRLLTKPRAEARAELLAGVSP